jgi:hypothetical protein
MAEHFFRQTLNLPIRTVSEANSNEHWLTKAKRHQQQQHFVRLAYRPPDLKQTTPCRVTLTRLAPRRLDSDNLQMSFKWIRDELSDLILPEEVKTYVNRKGKLKTLKGRSDDDPRITWQYSQEKASVLGIRIDIDFPEPS